MNQVSYQRSRERLAATARECEAKGHDWCPQDPITKRYHCRRCTAVVPGIPDQKAKAIRMGPWTKSGEIGDALGWNEETN